LAAALDGFLLAIGAAVHALTTAPHAPVTGGSVSHLMAWANHHRSAALVFPSPTPSTNESLLHAKRC